MKIDDAARSEGPRTAPAAVGLPRLMPFSLRALLYLTTSGWEEDGDTHPELARRIEAMRGDGWWVRAAFTRNYVLWRHGRTMRDPRRPVLVLPQSRGRVSPLSWSVFLAVEIVRAKERLQRGTRPDLSALALAELDELIAVVAAGSAVRIVDPIRLHREAAARFEVVMGL